MNERNADIWLENEILKAGIALHGAELRSLFRKDCGREYLWNGDPRYWGRVSPVLFPFVGGVRDKKYRIGDREYPMGQHGFARDRDFVLTEKTGSEAWFALEDDEESRQVYPFRFRLEIGYRLEENSIRVMWRVANTDRKNPLYFSIGAHPAFLCPLEDGEKQWDYQLRFQTESGRVLKEFTNRVFGQGGLATDQMVVYPLENGCLPIGEHLFDGDALILENDQVQKLSLVSPSGTAYLTVEFTSPLVGIWSPPGKQAPFVCIEPWYGRCDREGFDGELKDREWENALPTGGMFHADYRILTEKI